MITVTLEITENKDGDVAIGILTNAKDNIATKLEAKYADGLVAGNKHLILKLADLFGNSGVDVNKPFRPENQ